MSSATRIALGMVAVAAAGCGSDSSPAPQENATDASVLPFVDASTPEDAAVAADAVADAEPACRAYVPPSDCTIEGVLPGSLRCTGLYQDFAQRALHCNVLAYKPAYELWSDGADKQRYLYVPEGSKIDGSDPNGPVFPVGTKLWKEFRAPGSGRLLETRLLQKSELGWLFTTYVWNAAQTDALQENDGVLDVHGSGYDVPTRDQCGECHNGRPDRVLGMDAWLLGAGATGANRADLLARGLFASGKELPNLTVPGDDVERAALGYLHVNCGVSCHNGSSEAKAFDTGLLLRLEMATNGSAAAAPAYVSGAFRQLGTNVKPGSLTGPDGGAPQAYYRDLVPLDPARSFLLARMKTRLNEGQMPPLATKHVDDAGVAAVTRWIEQMTVARGYMRDGGT